MLKGQIRAVLISFLLFCVFHTSAQDLVQLKTLEDSLNALGKRSLMAKSYQTRKEAYDKIQSYWNKVLTIQNNILYPFDSIKTSNILTSNNKELRIVTWMLVDDEQNYVYAGYTQYLNPKTKKWEINFLADVSAKCSNPDYGQFNHKNWYGMLYYQLIEQKKKKTVQYTLLGWDGNNRLSHKKFIEPISFTGKGEPKFGDNIFKQEKKSPRRVIFEHSAQISMSLKYNDKDQQIVFDHLSPSESRLEGQYQFYGPDFSYDAYKFTKGKWVYVKDILPRNDPKEEYKPKASDKKENVKMYKPKQK